MLRRKTNSIKKLTAIGFLCLLTLMFLPTSNAGAVKPVPGEFNVVMIGVDSNTGELIFEGEKTGELPGHLTTRTGIIKQTGVALHLATRWTLTTPWGEIISGENTAVLNTESLHFREHGVIVDATGSLTERIGNFVVIHGEVSDVLFFPGVTEANAHVTYVPSRAEINN